MSASSTPYQMYLEMLFHIDFFPLLVLFLDVPRATVVHDVITKILMDLISVRKNELILFRNVFHDNFQRSHFTPQLDVHESCSRQRVSLAERLD